MADLTHAYLFRVADDRMTMETDLYSLRRVVFGIPKTRLQKQPRSNLRCQSRYPRLNHWSPNRPVKSSLTSMVLLKLANTMTVV